ncbi:MAG: hypothetical protein JWN86_3153 [Planctomycetota bacterium]|nr:hypothetical protein [Planctomycetota bacterium]
MFLLSNRRCSVRRARKDLTVRIEALEDRSLMSVLFPGNPVTVAPPQQFAAVGTTNVATAISSFRTAIGGVDNGATASPQVGGSRTINWDAVTTDGTDFGGGANTTVIAANTVGIPQDRFQTRGVFFETIYAVSSDGFVTVNPNVTGLFPAFSPSNTFAMFNDHTIDLSFVTAGANGTTPAPAATRGFGAVFLNSETANTSSIQYFDGDRLLATVFVPAGTAGQAEFAGALFASPLVTRVSLTLGTDTLFSFDGKTFTSGGKDDPAGGHNLVATDDFVYAEPQSLANLPTVVPGPQGTNDATALITSNVGAAFSGTVATFSSSNPTDIAKNFFAVINWGDGHLTNGLVTSNGQGGFDVSGRNTFISAGSFPVTVNVSQFAAPQVITLLNTAKLSKVTSQVSLTSSSSSGFSGQPITFTAKVTNPAGSVAPTGNVTFFDGATPLGLVPLDSTGTAKFTTSLTPGTHSITATYNGDTTSSTSTSTAISLVVSPDVTSFVSVVLGAKRRRRGGIIQRITITNRGNNAIGGPIFLVLDNLSSNVRLANSAGTTTNVAPLGSPFVRVSDGPLGAGSSVTVDLVFNVRRGRIGVNYRVLSGISQP